MPAIYCTQADMQDMCSSREEVPVDDLHARSSAQLLDRTRALVVERNRIDAELARTVRVAENGQAFRGDGMATAQSWLRGHCRLSAATASQVGRKGRALKQLPAVTAAHEAGDVTADQVALIGLLTAPRYAAPLAEQDGDLDGIATVLAEFAATHKHDELARLVHTQPARLDADGPEPDPTEQ